MFSHPQHETSPPPAAVRTAAAHHRSDEHSDRGRERLCDRRLGGRRRRWRRPAGRTRFVRHRAVHRRRPDGGGRGRCADRRRSARLPSARRTVGLRVAVRRRGHVQQAVRPVLRRRQPGVAHPGVLGTAERRRRDRAHQRPPGQQTEPRRLRPVPQGIRTGRQVAHDRRPADGQGTAARAPPETKETGTAAAADAAAATDRVFRRVHRRRGKASIYLLLCYYIIMYQHYRGSVFYNICYSCHHGILYR